MANKKGHWYTDKNGNHYFVEEGQSPQEGWEASKRRKMIDGGKYKVSEDGSEYTDVTEDEYNKYEADETDFDETNEDDFGFDDEDEAGGPYNEIDYNWVKDHIDDNPGIKANELIEDVKEKFGDINPEDEMEIRKIIDDNQVEGSQNSVMRDAEKLRNDPTIPMKEQWSDAYYNEVKEAMNNGGSQDKQYNIGDKFSVDGREFEVTKIDRDGEHIVGKDTKTGEEYDWTRKSLLENATEVKTNNEDGTRGEPDPGPHSMRDYVYERNHPDLGEDKRPQMNRNKKSDSNNLNPNNPKYKGFERSSITNAELVDEGYEFTDADTGEKRKESIISYIPYGSLQDGDNRRLYALVNNYDGTDTPKTGAIVAHSLEDAKEQLERQTQLGIQGRDRYLKRGQYDEDYFNIVRDNREPGDDEKYRERYGWDFNKPFAEHDFMKNDPYEKWKSDRIGNRKGKVGDRELSLNELIEKTNKLDDRELARDIIAIQAPKFNLSEKEILEYYDKVGKK